MRPRSRPPIRAPGIEPIPPNTAAVNALIPGIAPVVGVSVGYAEQRRTPAIAAKAEPMAKVMEIVLLTLIPISCAAPLSSEQARIAFPVLLFDVKSVRPTITIRQVIIVIIEI